MNNIRSLIVKELLKVSGAKQSGRNIKIPCPFHSDRDPSLLVFVGDEDNETTSLALGSWNCFGCAEHGNWNKLANKLGLKEISKQVLDENAFYLLDLELQEDKVYKYTKLPGLEQWQGNWRRFPEAFIMQFNPSLYYNELYDEFLMYLPITIDKKVIGHILCRRKKSKRYKNYIFSPGNWVKKALFPYDFFKSIDTVILTEGLADCLRLIYEGLPAMMIFGVNSWTKIKRNLLLRKGIKKIVIAMDGDKPGREAAIRIAEETQNYFEVSIFKLPLREKARAFDPYNMPSRYVKQLKRFIHD